MGTIYIKYGAVIDSKAIAITLNRITSQIFKLLPCREEGGDWKSPLNNLIVELSGMSSLMEDQTILFSLLCKMEGLLQLQKEEDFPQFRKTIFECLSLISEVKKCF